MGKPNELAIVIREVGIEDSQGKTILESFSRFFEQAKEWEGKAREIVVSDITQVDEMYKAREARLALKDIRVKAEKARKELKEDSLRQGKAIDGMANIIKALIVPIEEYLEKQEKFVETLEEEKRQKRNAERIAALQPYVEDVGMYSLQEMSDEVFAKLLQNSKSAYEAQKKAEEKAQEEIVAKQKAEKDEQERIRVENEKLKKEREVREREVAKERAEAESKLKKEREEAESKLRKEREAREKAAEELRRKEEQERIAEEKRQAEIRVKEETERQAKLAPEKEKLFVFAENIKSLAGPEGLSKAGLKIVKIAEAELLAASQKVKDSIKDL